MNPCNCEFMFGTSIRVNHRIYCPVHDSFNEHTVTAARIEQVQVELEFQAYKRRGFCLD